MRGIYVHVPFCERKCPYCAFYSRAADRHSVEGYMASLIRSIEGFGDKVQADTLYFGGGTPNLLGAENIAEIISSCRKVFGLDNAEITLECNPNSSGLALFRELKDCGVNRISVGVQSLDDSELEFLGRLHDTAQALKTLEAAKQAGFDNVSADLMIGIKGQTAEKLDASIAELAGCGVSHLSVYMIKVEKGTRFDSDDVRSRLMEEDGLADLYLAVVDSCERHGFMQYEISNFAKAGMESRHNCKYWEREEYIGFGPSAHSFYKGVRYCYPDDIDGFISGSCAPVITDPSPDAFEEYVMLGLRLRKGISLEKLESFELPVSRYRRIISLAERFAKAGFCSIENGYLSLTPKGMLLSNSIITELLYD